MVTFYYPISGPLEESIVLPNPTLGDTRQVDVKTKFSKPMNIAVTNKLYSYKSTPVTNKLLLSFVALTPTAATELKAFLAATASLVIAYLDYNSDTWHGKIVTPVASITTTGRHAYYDYDGIKDITLEFEGEKR